MCSTEALKESRGPGFAWTSRSVTTGTGRAHFDRDGQALHRGCRGCLETPWRDRPASGQRNAAWASREASLLTALFLTLERENLIDRAALEMFSAEVLKEARGALAHKDFPELDDETWTRHTHCLGWEGLTTSWASCEAGFC